MIIKKLIKDWTLVTAMALGALCSLAFAEIPFLAECKPQVDAVTQKMMPFLMFSMLFLSFTSISPRNIKFQKWHLWHVLFQIGCSSLFLFLLLPVDRDVACAIFISFICPTAVASSVITDKLKGNVASLVSYILIINCVVSFAIPLIIPMIPGCSDFKFIAMVWKIMRKIFPLLVVPIIAAWSLRLLLPKVHDFFYRYRWISFYIWAFSLVILIAGIVDAVFIDGHISFQEIAIMGISAFACVIQFAFGRIFGKKYGDRISGGQALGQKNTIFAIWLASTFLSPVAALAPGSYILWQNIINSIELRKFRKSLTPHTFH